MKAYELLEQSAHWTQMGEAKDRTGHFVSPTNGEAKQWCAVGALRKCYPWRWEAKAKQLANHLEPQTLYTVIDIIGYWNDNNNHETVVATLRKLDM